MAKCGKFGKFLAAFSRAVAKHCSSLIFLFGVS